MKLTFLEASERLSKSYALDSEGQLIKSSYPHVRDFTSHDFEVADLKAFSAALETQAALGRCLLKGNVGRRLVHESRAGATDPMARTSWGCFDIDRLPGVASPAAFMKAIGLPNVSFVNQYSSAYGIEKDRGLASHVFVRFAMPAAPAQLKLWLMYLNLTNDTLRPFVELTKSHMALSWPLDVTTCQNDKLLYIAPPTCTGFEVPDIERIEYVERANEFVDLGLLNLPPMDKVREMMEDKINELRKASGLSSRKFVFKNDILVKCDQAILTDLKRERGYTYFNLNGGDSWAYWHPDENPEVIRNFKGEPNYRTEELLPEYWAYIHRPIEGGEAAPDDKLVLAFRDFYTGQYLNGTLEGGVLELAPAKSEKQLNDWRAHHGLPKIKEIPVWRLGFDPHSKLRVDQVTQTINVWEPSPYMTGEFPQGPYPVVTKLIEHAIGEGEVYDHFINWIACAWRIRKPLGSAWIWHGTQGTGKGVLIHKVLKPLFGDKYVAMRRMVELEDKFNSYLEHSLLVVIDEAQISDSKQSKMIMADLKNLITEPTISVRRMHTSATAEPNYTNWIFLSNMPDPVMIDSTDRRFNVGVYQRQPIKISVDEIDAIEGELEAFARHLADYPIDRDRAAKVLDTEDRNEIIRVNQTSADLVAEAIRNGDLTFFWDALPGSNVEGIDFGMQLTLNEYRKIVHDAVRHGRYRFTREEIRVLFHYLVGDMPKSPTKFTQFARHRNLRVNNPVSLNGKMVRGLDIAWKIDAAWRDEKIKELGYEPGSKEQVVGSTA